MDTTRSITGELELFLRCLVLRLYQELALVWQDDNVCHGELQFLASDTISIDCLRQVVAEEITAVGYKLQWTNQEATGLMGYFIKPTDKQSVSMNISILPMGEDCSVQMLFQVQ